MTANHLTGEVHTFSLVAWQEFPETLMWPHSSRCSFHGQDQSLVQRIYNCDAAAVPLLHVTLVISNEVLFLVNLTLFQTHQCLPTLVSKTVGPQFLLVERWVLVWVHQAMRAGQVPYLGRESRNNCLAAGKENLITYSFENLTILPFKKTWLWGEKTEVAFFSYTNVWKWTSSVPNRGITNMTNVAVMPSSAISTAVNLPSWTVPLAAGLPCPSLQECLSCHVSELFLSRHTTRFSFCSVSVVPHVLWPSSLTPWHKGLSPQALLSLWLSVRRYQLVSLVVFQSSAALSIDLPLSKFPLSLFIHPQMQPHNLN